MNLESMDAALVLRHIPNEKGAIIFKADHIMHGALINETMFIDFDTGKKYINISKGYCSDVEEYFYPLENYSTVYSELSYKNFEYIKEFGFSSLRSDLANIISVPFEKRYINEISKELASSENNIIGFLDLEKLNKRTLLRVLRSCKVNSLYDLSGDVLSNFALSILNLDSLNKFLVDGEYLDIREVPNDILIEFLNKNGINQLNNLSDNALFSLFLFVYQEDIGKTTHAFFNEFDNKIFFYDADLDKTTVKMISIEDFEKTSDVDVDVKTVREQNDYVATLLSVSDDTFDEYMDLLDCIEDGAEEFTASDLNKISSIISEVKKDVFFFFLAVKKTVISVYKNIFFDNPKTKNNILLYGPSGCGKTALVTSLATQFNLPFAKFDMSHFTETGYKGNNINDIFVRLINNCNGDVKKAERSIVFLDEIDKKASKTREEGTKKGVLEGLLTVLESGVIDVELNPYTTVSFDTSHLIIIAAGAFSDLYKDKAHVIQGFGQDNTIQKNKVSEDDLVNEAGIPEELLGRFRECELHGLSEEQYVEILKYSRQSRLNIYINEFKKREIELVVPDSLYKTIAKNITSSKLGARRINKIVEDILDDTFYSFFEDCDNIEKIILGNDIVNNSEDYTLVKKIA